MSLAERNERYRQILRFKVQVYQSDGQSFENFFTAIMCKRSPTFAQVKPQGSWGDRKNDGYDHSTGTYYQVFAPEESWTGDAYGADKLQADFQGLLAHWNGDDRVKRFRYVVNDKYRGIGPKIHQELESLRKSYSKIDIDPLLAGGLCDEFTQLRLADQDEILSGPCPEPLRDTVDHEALSEVVSHLLKKTEPFVSAPVPQSVDFERKIEFNGLTNHPASILRTKSIEARSDLNSFFKYRSKIEKQQLADIFVQYYIAARNLFQGDDNAADLTFYYIHNKVFPSTTRYHQDAVYVLMSYFFESCDIFEAATTQ